MCSSESLLPVSTASSSVTYWRNSSSSNGRRTAIEGNTWLGSAQAIFAVYGLIEFLSSYGFIRVFLAVMAFRDCKRCSAFYEHLKTVLYAIRIVGER